jgi:hypothetical protein
MKTMVYAVPEIEFYTYVEDWLPILCDEPSNYNFALAEVETSYEKYLLNEWKVEKSSIEYWIPGNELYALEKRAHLQFIWAVFSAIKKKEYRIDDLNVDNNFYIDGNRNITLNNETKYIKESDFEIIAFDSSFFVLQSDNIEFHNRIREKYKKARDIV